MAAAGFPRRVVAAGFPRRAAAAAATAAGSGVGMCAAGRRRGAVALASVLCGLLAAGAGAPERYSRNVAAYAIPDVTLTDQGGAAVRLVSELGRPGPVLLQFIFTTCSTVCPALSGIFSAVQERLPGVRLVSISIDPDEDTPARLAAYARRFGAGPRWRLLTGRPEDVIAVERAFDVYRGNKMRHRPVTLARAAPGQPWLRLDGLPTAAELAAEVRGLAAAPAAASAAPAAAAIPAPVSRSATNAAPADAGKAPARGAAGAAERQTAATAAAALAAAEARGRRIYRDGLLPSGGRLRAAVAGGGADLENARLACASCHRPSGYGGVEAGSLVPPIAAPALFAGRQAPAADLLGKLYRDELAPASWTRLRSAAAAERPAYTDQTLADAVRRGTDPRGRVLDPLMPRYALDGAAMADLAAYLRTLSAAPAPGVDAATIHFAIVVAGDVEPERRRAMLDVARAFFRTKNDDTRRQLSRPPFSPGYRDELRQHWRQWALHVWELHGPQATWGAQLERAYAAQPVFALLSGIGAGAADWRPVHELCERREVPCLFPNTDLPVVAPPGAWTIYLSAGLALEGRALARHLAEASAAGKGLERVERVVQVYRAGAAGRTAAAALREAVSGGLAAAPGVEPENGPAPGRTAPPGGMAPVRSGDLASGAPARARVHAAGAAPPACLEDVVIGADGAAAAAAAEVLAAVAARGKDRRTALILWLDRVDAAALLPALAAGGQGVRELYLSYSLLGEELPPLPDTWRDRTRLTCRYALPGRPAPEGYRARAWLASRGVAGPYESIRLDTFFALAMASDALERLAGRFSREYLVETVERETERAPNPGVFPRLSLGAGQRFAAKGCYVVRLAADGPGAGPSLVPESDWIVP